MFKIIIDQVTVESFSSFLTWLGNAAVFQEFASNHAGISNWRLVDSDRIVRKTIGDDELSRLVLFLRSLHHGLVAEDLVLVLHQLDVVFLGRLWNQVQTILERVFKRSISVIRRNFLEIKTSPH